MSKHAYFITLEGGEASGKSTNLKLIDEWLTQKNIPHIITHEPGGTPLAEEIRNLLLHKEGNETLSETAELLLMFASRAQHLKQVIEPALKAGQWVVCSRFTDSSYAYQGGGRGIDINKIAALEKVVHPHLQPDLTILLDLPLAIANDRSQSRSSKDRIEKENQVFFEKVRQAYLKLAEAHKDRFRVIDASQPLKEVQTKFIELLEQLNTA